MFLSQRDKKIFCCYKIINVLYSLTARFFILHFERNPPIPTFNVEKVAEVGTWGKNPCLFQYCARGRGHFWNFLNLKGILKYFFHHCLNFWSGVETSSDWKIKLSTTLFLFWKLLKQTLILICKANSKFYRLIFIVIIMIVTAVVSVKNLA